MPVRTKSECRGARQGFARYLSDPGSNEFEVVAQWLGGQGPFEIYRSPDPTNVVAPGNLLGQTTGRNWADTPPAGEVFYFRVIEP